MLMELSRYLAIVDVDAFKDDITEKTKKIVETYKPSIMLRAKNLKGKYFYEYAKAIRDITLNYGVLFFVNERFDIALALGANGVHLPSNALDVSVVKNICKDMIIGYSAHSKEDVLEAFQKGADYVTLSPIFPTKSHENATPLGLEYLEDVVKSSKKPIFALGGITKENIDDVFKTGVYGIASIRFFL
jgi:Thiamine monophosphate synthase